MLRCNIGRLHKIDKEQGPETEGWTIIQNTGKCFVRVRTNCMMAKEKQRRYTLSVYNEFWFLCWLFLFSSVYLRLAIFGLYQYISMCDLCYHVPEWSNDGSINLQSKHKTESPIYFFERLTGIMKKGDELELYTRKE